MGHLVGRLRSSGFGTLQKNPHSFFFLSCALYLPSLSLSWGWEAALYERQRTVGIPIQYAVYWLDICLSFLNIYFIYIIEQVFVTLFPCAPADFVQREAVNSVQAARVPARSVRPSCSAVPRKSTKINIWGGGSPTCGRARCSVVSHEILLDAFKLYFSFHGGRRCVAWTTCVICGLSDHSKVPVRSRTAF
jgi:hypothetical protein